MNELYHHGIKGQKWGIRRYRNEDGSLTEAGKRRLQKKNYKTFRKGEMHSRSTSSMMKDIQIPNNATTKKSITELRNAIKERSKYRSEKEKIVDQYWKKYGDIYNRDPKTMKSSSNISWIKDPKFVESQKKESSMDKKINNINRNIAKEVFGKYVDKPFHFIDAGSGITMGKEFSKTLESDMDYKFDKKYWDSLLKDSIEEDW